MDSIVASVIADIALVFVIASLLGAAARKCGQPAVIGQILTGVVLGPSLLGRLPGHLTSHLFPSDALPYLTVLSVVLMALITTLTTGPLLSVIRPVRAPQPVQANTPANP